MAVNRKSLKENLTVKKLNYSDDFFKLKKEVKTLDDSFAINNYEAFKDINSIKTNNYSNLILSKKQTNSKWLDTNTRDNESQKNLITTISFFSNDPTDPANPGVWLYFDKNYEFWDAYVNAVEYKLTEGRPEKSYTNHIFYIEFIDDTHCTISHWFGDLKFYAKINEKLNFEFTTKKNDDCYFLYNLDNDKILLYKKIKTEEYTKLYSICCGKNSENEWCIELKDITENNIEADSDVSVMYITNNILDIDFYTSSSYVSYDRSNSIDSIDRNRSAFNIETQALFHHEYNKNDGINFIPLKNNLTYKGHSGRGSNLTISSPLKPDVNYRNYTSINTTKQQELGPENIMLNYIFNDQDFTIKDGEVFTFSIPTVEESGTFSPLYPYKYININDTKFVRNGAFGSDCPAFSDKIKSLQSIYNTAVDEEGERATANTEQYLCTWLYKKDIDSEPVWLDRYYYPDKIRKESALLGVQHFKESFENVLDKNYKSDTIKNTIKNNTYFDKVSDMIIQPGNSYTYYRVSSKNINEMLGSISDRTIDTCLSDSSLATNLFDRKQLSGKSYYKIDYNDFKKTNKLNVNFDAYLTPNKKMGIQLFGCDHNNGFNIQNRKDLAPLHYYATSEEIFLLNDNFKKVRSFNLFKKYGEPIIRYIIGEQFDDIVIVSNMALYVLSYDLKLVSKIDFSDEDLNIDDKSKSFISIENMLQYPFKYTYYELTPEEFENGLANVKGDFYDSKGIDFSVRFGGSEETNQVVKEIIEYLPIPTSIAYNYIFVGSIETKMQFKYTYSSDIYLDNTLIAKIALGNISFIFGEPLHSASGVVDKDIRKDDFTGTISVDVKAKYTYSKVLSDGTEVEVIYITGPINQTYKIPAAPDIISSGKIMVRKRNQRRRPNCFKHSKTFI